MFVCGGDSDIVKLLNHYSAPMLARIIANVQATQTYKEPYESKEKEKNHLEVESGTARKL